MRPRICTWEVPPWTSLNPDMLTWYSGDYPDMRRPGPQPETDLITYGETPATTRSAGNTPAADPPALAPATNGNNYEKGKEGKHV